MLGKDVTQYQYKKENVKVHYEMSFLKPYRIEKQSVTNHNAPPQY